MPVYLIHLESKFAHTQHYVGWTRNIDLRIDHHRRGTGARYLQVANQKGIGWKVVRTWENADKAFERRIKNCKHNAQLCPVCNPDGWMNRYPEYGSQLVEEPVSDEEFWKQ